jgi:hypothetical protein
MRKTTLVAGFALVALLSTPTFAQRSGPPGPIELNLGTTLATPPLSGFFFICQVVNVGPTTVLVAVKIFDSTGTQISVSGDGSDPAVCTATQQLQPHHACRVPANDFTFRFSSCCTITVVGGADAVRGSLSDDNGNAVEAR